MSIQIDPTVFSIVIVLAVLGIGLLAKDIRVTAIGALALIVVLLIAKVTYLEPPVIFAMIALGVLAMFGDEIQKAAEEVVDGDTKIVDKDEDFKKQVVQAYAEQYAPAGHFMTVSIKYSDSLLKKCNAWDDFNKELWFDDHAMIALGGADTIDKIIISREKPYEACIQFGEIKQNRRIWVRVTVGDRDDVWVRVKAYIFKIPWHKYGISEGDKEVNGVIWNKPLDTVMYNDLYRQVYPYKSEQLLDAETHEVLAEKVDYKYHHWDGVIAEV